MKTFSSKKTNYLEEHFRFVMIKHDLSIKAVIMAMDFFIWMQEIFARVEFGFSVLIGWQ